MLPYRLNCFMCVSGSTSFIDIPGCGSTSTSRSGVRGRCRPRPGRTRVEHGVEFRSASPALRASRGLCVQHSSPGTEPQTMRPTWDAPGGPRTSWTAAELEDARSRAGRDARTHLTRPCCACSPPSIRTLTVRSRPAGRVSKTPVHSYAIVTGFISPFVGPAYSYLHTSLLTYPLVAVWRTPRYQRVAPPPTLWWPCGGRLGISAFGPPSL
jgi:hypothetical protein